MTREEAIKRIQEHMIVHEKKEPRAIYITKALQMAINALEQTKWIPCTERLPEPKRLVLCYITTGATKTYFLAFWNDIQNDWEEGIGGCRLLENDLGYEVIAWMPLPTSYQTESEEEV